VPDTFFSLTGILRIHDLPGWLFGTVVVGAFVAFALIGQLVVRRYLPRWFGDKEYNDLVGHYLSASGVFFGITLGLLSVGAWENFTAVEAAVSLEATEIGVLYRTADNYPEPHRAILTEQLRAYTRHEIDNAWPKQQAGITPGPVGNKILDKLHRDLVHIEPVSEAQKALHREALHLFNDMVRARRERLSSVSTRLPPLVWGVVIGGSVLNLSLMWLFVFENKRLHILLTTILASLLGLLVFLLAVMDFPFAGAHSVGPDAFELIYDQFMKK
jgi:hypothetical protein